VKPYIDDGDFRLYVGDVRDVLRELPDASVDCVATSPPFYALRDYGVDGQIGLEETPELWVEALVGVFHETRRVLADTGTLWVECGDSYAGSRCGPAGGRHVVQTDTFVKSKRDGKRWGGGDTAVPGVKPKDLMGTPWMLAKALRDPYYTGRIKNERDRIWLAAMVDAEGCIHIHKRKAGSSAHSSFTKNDGTVSEYVRKNDTYGVMVSVSNTSEAIIDRCAAIYGLGSKGASEAGTGKQQRKQTLYRWTVTGDQARNFVRELYPYLLAKQHEARIALGCPRSGDEAGSCQEAIKFLHNGRSATVDYKPPASLFEPGWYLRQAIIWAKSNAMPESATDRCTTAHSYVFLLSKQARYHFDAEAIAEAAEWARWGDQTVPKYEGTDTASGWMQPKSKREIMALSDHPYDGLVGQKWKKDGREGNGQRERDDKLRGFDERRDRADGKKNPRSVWTIPTQGYSEAHFATWPEALVERIIKAGCPEGGTVLDPFMGSGTTALVARRLGRKSVGIELNAEYAKLAAKRLQQLSLLAEDVA
jgi:DNA modification methylase